MRILGIGRSPRFSPNSEARDAAILQAVAERLRQKGHHVATVCEDDALPTDFDAAFCMARHTATLRRLAQMEAEGLPIINSPLALLTGSRRHLTESFVAEGLPVVAGVGIDAVNARPDQAYWLKRGDACAQQAADVQFAATGDEVADRLGHFKARGIDDVLIFPHVAGDLVKFYGVEGTAFFHHYYPTAGPSFSKFGLESHNGAPTGYAFDATRLKAVADEAARLSGLTVYGGDCIIDSDGRAWIIDFNDWPSFSRCCAEAARAIAQRIVTETQSND